MVNAILWTAKVDIPTGGAKVDFDSADLNKNLDDKRNAKQKEEPYKPILPPEKKQPKE